MVEDDKKLHHELNYVGLRAQATAAGLLQLCIELRKADLLPEEAIDRIKDRIACEITLSAPRSIKPEDFGRDIRNRLNRLFAGAKVGSAEALSFGASDGH